MKNSFITDKRHIPLLIIAGIGAGFLNGLLGAGAGVILVFVYAALSKDKSDGSVKDNFAMTVATVIPISVFSTVNYVTKVGADLSKSLVFLIPGAVGGLLGAWVTDKIKTSHLKFIFAILTAIAGINMIFR
ncbi:MAG: sulfite exporter TauE/SafE family protein [Ruminococcaceae bacterium]|nr:sulfite exporter TauE/SafE family protein [Oscillospiraceae bacterium]